MFGIHLFKFELLLACSGNRSLSSLSCQLADICLLTVHNGKFIPSFIISSKMCRKITCTSSHYNKRQWLCKVIKTKEYGMYEDVEKN